jgi:hypothetical protein
MCKNKQGVIVGDEKVVLEVWASILRNYLIPKLI